MPREVVPAVAKIMLSNRSKRETFFETMRAHMLDISSVSDPFRETKIRFAEQIRKLDDNELYTIMLAGFNFLTEALVNKEQYIPDLLRRTQEEQMLKTLSNTWSAKDLRRAQEIRGYLGEQSTEDRQMMRRYCVMLVAVTSEVFYTAAQKRNEPPSSPLHAA